MAAVMDRIGSRVHFVQVHADDPYWNARAGRRATEGKNKRFYFFDIHGDLLVVQYFKLLSMKRFESECFSPANEWREWLKKSKSFSQHHGAVFNEKAFIGWANWAVTMQIICVSVSVIVNIMTYSGSGQTKKKLFNEKIDFWLFCCFALNCTESGAHADFWVVHVVKCLPYMNMYVYEFGGKNRGRESDPIHKKRWVFNFVISIF